MKPLDNINRKYLIVFGIVYILILIVYFYHKYKDLYIPDFFKSTAELAAERKRNEEAAKTFGVPASHVVLDMDFRNKYHIPPENIQQCFEGVKDNNKQNIACNPTAGGLSNCLLHRIKWRL